MVTSAQNSQFVCVVEQMEQFYALQKYYPNLSTIRLYCICSETSILLRDRGVDFVEVSEEFLRPHWNPINDWAKKISLSWFENARVKPLLEFDGINMGDVLYRPLANLFVWQVKNMQFAHAILSDNPNASLLVFENYFRRLLVGRRKEVPTFNQLLLHIAREKGRPVRPIACGVGNSRPFSVKQWLKKPIGLSYVFKKTRAHRVEVVSSGALKYLLPVLEGLGKSHSLGLLGVQGYQKKDVKTCLDLGMSYLLPESVLSLKDWWRLLAMVRSIPGRLKALKKNIVREDIFRYQGQSVPMMAEIVLFKMRQLLPVKFKLMLTSEAIVKIYKPKLVLLDEDVDWRRVLAMTFLRHDVPVVVLSHGIPPSTSDTSGFIANAGVGKTIVNSRFEKERYIMAGWKDEQLYVLGLPRYDAIHAMVQKELARNGSSPEMADKESHPSPNRFTQTVLYCPHMLSRKTRRKEGFLGVHTPGDETRFNTLAVIHACEKIGCHLVIKPHSDAGDIGLWEALVQEHGGKDVTLTSWADDIFRLIASSDVVVATFSTVLVEAVLFGKPAVSINFSGKPDVHPYVKMGLAVGVKKTEDLPAVLQEALSRGIGAGKAEIPQGVLQYFCGSNDGKNTQRVVEFLSEEMKAIVTERKEVRLDRMHHPSEARVHSAAGQGS